MDSWLLRARCLNVVIYNGQMPYTGSPVMHHALRDDPMGVTTLRLRRRGICEASSSPFAPSPFGSYTQSIRPFPARAHAG